MKQIMKVQMQKILSKMTFTQALEASKKLNEVVNLADGHLQTFPKGAFGLTPDDVKNTVEFKTAKFTFDIAFQNLRNFNQYYTKKFKRELAQMRDEKRALQIACNAK
jgi:hypothetical protein